MKKYSAVFLFSFLAYILVFFAIPYVTARTWANVFAMLFTLSCCFQLLYIIYLRKKESVSAGRSISRYFLYLSFTAIVVAIIWYGDNFFNGYTPTSFFGQQTGETVYGFEAVINDRWSHIIFVPLVWISFIYQIGYHFISRKLKNKAAQ